MMLKELLVCVFWVAVGIIGSAVLIGFRLYWPLVFTIPLGIIGFFSLTTGIELRRLKRKRLDLEENM